MSHILIADDEPDICMLLEIQMEALGHTCTTVADGLQALDALSTTAFDLAILDIWMPRSPASRSSSRSARSTTTTRCPSS